MCNPIVPQPPNDVKPTLQERTITVKRYVWTCPRCQIKKLDRAAAQGEPTEDDLLCRGCQEVVYQERFEAWRAEFKRRRRLMIGAKIISIEPFKDDFDDAYIYRNPHETAGTADIRAIIVETAGGTKVRIDTDSDIPYLLLFGEPKAASDE